MTLDWLDSELRRLSRERLLRDQRVVRPLGNGWCDVDGTRCRNFASNDYLNLAGDPRIRDAAQQALSESGVGATASALICGRSPWHERLEQALADFEQTDAAVLFPTGYAANLGTITALIHSCDIVFSDRLNHASLIDGIRLSGAGLRVYRHDRLDVLERELKKARLRTTSHLPDDGHSEGTSMSGSSAGGATDGAAGGAVPLRSGKNAVPKLWIVTDSVFSMDGDLAPLSELCDLADRFSAAVIVDEAHATGLFGNNGRGVCEADGTESRVAVRTGTLSKAIGCLGGFVACSHRLRNWLWNSARTQMFSTALPPPVCAAAAESLRIIRDEPWRRDHLHVLSQRLVAQLRDQGLTVPAGVAGPIVPVLTGAAEPAMRAAAQLQADGFLVGAVRPPTVPHQTSRLRICVSAAFEDSDIDDLASAVSRCLRSCTRIS